MITGKHALRLREQQRAAVAVKLPEQPKTRAVGKHSLARFLQERQPMG